MTDCVIYARVSTKEQEREGFSIPSQLELLREYAKRNDFRVAHEYVEAETAKSSGREQFNLMLQALKHPKAPKIVLVEKTDRLYRNFKDYVAIEDCINSHGLVIHLVKESEILDKDARSHAKLMHGIKVLMAKNYIDNLSEEVRKGLKQKVLEGGFCGKAPFGYKNDKATKELIVDPIASAFVIRAFQIYSTNIYSLEATSQKLYDEGFMYQPYLPKIGKSKLHAMLSDRIYIGEVEFHGEIYQGKHPPLVDRLTFEAVQHSFRKDNKPIAFNRRDFTYRGFLYCGECGKASLGEVKKGKYTYYRCADMKKSCSQGYVSEDKIDSEIQAFMKSLYVPENYKNLLRQTMKDLDNTYQNSSQDELNQILAQKERLKTRKRKAYFDRLDGLIDLDTYREVNDNIELEMSGLDKRMANLSKADIRFFDLADTLLELPEMLTRNWFAAFSDEKKMLLKILCSNFFVKDGKIDVALKEPFLFLSQIPLKNEKLPLQDAARTFLLKHFDTIQELRKLLCA